MIDRYDFWSRPLSLRGMMDRLFQDAFVLPAGQPTPRGPGALDIYEEGDNLVVAAHVPGIKPEDIDVQVERGVLTIRAETKAEEERKDRNYLVREHRAGSFVRSVRLPEWADVDGAQAAFKHGVLSVTFPKAKPAQPHRIPLGPSGQAAVGTSPAVESGTVVAASSTPHAAETSAAQDGAQGHRPTGTSEAPTGTNEPATAPGQATNGSNAANPEATARKAARGSRPPKAPTPATS
jgi:HSP20 family protein